MKIKLIRLAIALAITLTLGFLVSCFISGTFNAFAWTVDIKTDPYGSVARVVFIIFEIIIGILTWAAVWDLK